LPALPVTVTVVLAPLLASAAEPLNEALHPTIVHDRLLR
jgi:hypothetical protein